MVILVEVGAFYYILKKDDSVVETPVKESEKKLLPLEVHKASLIASGDGLLHSTVYNGCRKDGTQSYDCSQMLTYIADYVKDFDLAYYNQETVSDDSRSYVTYPTFNTPSAFNTNMLNIGFNLVSLATNHSMDMGPTSGKKSAAWWESQENVLATGMASTEEMRNREQIKEINGITYAMLSYTYGTNGMPVGSDSSVVNVFNEEMAEADIKAIRDKVDVLIVAMHWGNEYNLGVTDTQRKQAKFLADMGVDIILGNHSHCVEPWEVIGKTVVFYSFGNFISNQMGANTPNIRQVGSTGLLGMLDITKTIDPNNNNKTTITIDNIRGELIYTYRYSDSSTVSNWNYQVVPYTQLNEKQLSSLENINGTSIDNIYNKYIKVLDKYNDDMKIYTNDTTKAKLTAEREVTFFKNTDKIINDIVNNFVVDTKVDDNGITNEVDTLKIYDVSDYVTDNLSFYDGYVFVKYNSKTKIKDIYVAVNNGNFSYRDHFNEQYATKTLDTQYTKYDNLDNTCKSLNKLSGINCKNIISKLVK